MKTKKRDREREGNGIGLIIIGRLLVMRRKMREQILMPTGTSNETGTCHAEFVHRTQLEKLPLATVGSEAREGKRRIQVGSRVLSSPDHLWQP